MTVLAYICGSATVLAAAAAVWAVRARTLAGVSVALTVCVVAAVCTALALTPSAVPPGPELIPHPSVLPRPSVLEASYG